MSQLINDFYKDSWIFTINDSHSARAIQILCPSDSSTDRSYKLNLDDSRCISEIDGMNDRHVAVVSIAGAFRKGKSFLLNFSSST